MHDVLTSDALYCNVIVKIVLTGHVETLVGNGDAGIPLFFRVNFNIFFTTWCWQGRRNERYADCCVLERDRFGGGGGGEVLSWSGQPLHMAIIHHQSSLMTI